MVISEIYFQNYIRRHIFLVKQFWTICRWIQNEVRASTVIQLELPGFTMNFFFEIRLVSGKLIPIWGKSRERAQFFVRPPGGDHPKPEWKCIFHSSDIEVFEKNTNRETIPIRRGLTDEERVVSLRIARDALAVFLLKEEELPKEYFAHLSSRFSQRIDVDVTLWVKGELRGSQIVEQLPYGHGIAAAARRSSRDARFKPLAYAELPHTRIQITLLHALRLPLAIWNDTIFPEKGYLLKRGSRRGWFLPAIFNIQKFQNFMELLRALEQKAGLPPLSCNTSDIMIFETDDFVESFEHQWPLALAGPVPRTAPIELDDIGILKKRLCLAADWLCRIQEPDGYLPSTINPFTGRHGRMNWTRMAFSVWALGEFGKEVNKARYLVTAEKGFQYLAPHLLGVERLESFRPALTYFGQLALVLDAPAEAKEAGRELLSLLPGAPFDPIFHGATASFFKALAKEDAAFSLERQKLLQMLKQEFITSQKNNFPMSLASWAELANAFSGEEFSQDVCEWLKRQQLSNGAFPNTSAESNFTYTRGTGKVFEVLVLRPAQNLKTIQLALSWLVAMQYDNESSFFVPHEYRDRIIGGFRHDHLNQEAWIDAAGHFLRGGSRLLAWLK